MARNQLYADDVRCPTGKRCFRSKAKAARILKRGTIAQSTIRQVYLCNLCGTWHLTKQRPKKKSKKQCAPR